MEENNLSFNSVRESHKGHKKVAFVSVIVCTLLLFVSEQFISDAIVRISLQQIMIMLLTYIADIASSSFVILLFFSCETMKSSVCYDAAILLMAAMCIKILLKHECFSKWWMAALSDIVMSVVCGNLVCLLNAVLRSSAADVGKAASIRPFLIALAPCSVVCIACFLATSFLPDRIKNYLSACIVSNYKMYRTTASGKRRKFGSISTKVFYLVFAEGLTITISALGFGNSLLLLYGGLDSDWDSIVFATRLFVCMNVIAFPTMFIIRSIMDYAITNPIMLMTKAVEDSGGQVKEENKDSLKFDIHDLKIKSHDELEVLYDTLVKSADNVARYIENLNRQNELEKSLEVEKRASKAKSAFLSSMSHEIRTPINAVLGLDEMILRESNEKGIVTYAQDIQSAGKSLLSLVNDILDFSKIEAGKMEIIPVEYDLSSTINDLVNMVSKRAEDKGLELILDINEEIPHMLYGDEIRVKQCAVNILTNAVKYTQKGSVTLSVKYEKINDENISLIFRIKDTGIGIKEEDIPKLTKSFQRVDEKKNRNIEGTGLGMSIVKQLLDLMGGKLEIKSVYGKGSEFSFTLNQKVIKWEPIGNFNETYKKSLEAAAAYHESFTAPDAKVLVVDDTRMNLTVFKGLLKQTLIQIDTAESGKQALEMVTKAKYDILFIDHRMPVMDGIETLKAMQTLDGNKSLDAPTVALTANAVSGAREMYIEAGFTDYLTKPINSKKLEDMIIHYLPKDKVKLYDGQKTDLKKETKQESIENENLKQLDGKKINLEAGLANCGGEDILLSAIKDFYSSIEEKSGLIEKYAAQKDIKNYTVIVHALKSSARIIGAAELSDNAAYLEKCGDKADISEIEAKTPALLELYRSYKDVLSPLFPKEDDNGKEKMTSEMYKGALENIKECVTAFDFDTAESIIEMMENYKIPEEYSEQFDNIRKKIMAVDRAAVMELL